MRALLPTSLPGSPKTDGSAAPQQPAGAGESVNRPFLRRTPLAMRRRPSHAGPGPGSVPDGAVPIRPGRGPSAWRWAAGRPDRAPGMRKAVAAHLGVPHPGQRAAPPSADDQEVIAAVRDLDQRRARLAADNDGRDAQVRRDATPSGVECAGEPLPDGVRPQAAQVSRGAAPLGEIPSGRDPGQHGEQRNCQVPRVPQRGEAAWRPAGAGDLAGQGPAGHS
jgi:hypothetical protein